jgi:LacI family transcriptional regulator
LHGPENLEAYAYVSENFGGTMVTSRDIAKMAGVSQATVSRVLQNHAGVSKATRDAVLQVLATSSYRPNLLARAMKTNRTGTIGVVVARLSNPLYPELLQIIGTKLRDAGQRMIVWDAETEGDQAASDAVRQGLVDGVIFTTATAQTRALREIEPFDTPIVLLNRVVEDCKCDLVSSDNYAGGRRVAEYLVKCGKKRIGMISGSSKASTIRDRERGFRDGLHAHGATLQGERYISVDIFSHQNGASAMARLLELANRPDAVFCANDIVALGALDAARTSGICVPDDLWVVGYDDIEMAAWSAYELTTVRQPLHEMVDMAVNLLLSRIASPGQPWATRCLPNELILRRSTARTPLPADDHQASAATDTEAASL